ncbi:unknown [Acidaminococcus sp. CAG:917]|nr:unknown [Acidaminococcus sp. CAG:917]
MPSERFPQDCSAISSVTLITPFESGFAVRTASSSEFNAFRISPFAMSAICFKALGSISMFILPSPFCLFFMAFLSPCTTSSVLSFLNSKTLHLDTIALVIEEYGFSVVEPINIIVPCSIACNTLSD